MSQIFISYARKDHFFVDRMREDLAREDVKYWIDHEGLSPGTTSWEKAIREALNNCHSVLWIVSPASFESAYVRDEISIARLYELKIYPIFADGENWLECVPLGTGEIQYIDARTDYQGALQKILKELEASTSDYRISTPEIPSLPAGVDPRNPYKGLLTFTENDSDDFFGREALTEKLKGRVLKTLEAKSDRFLAVMGASGAGKSSVVLAGLIPSLRKSHESWTILPKIVPGTHPIEALADSLYSAMPEKSLSAIETDLKSPGGRMLHRLANQIEGEQVILYIDQFEELFTLTDDEDERHQFINLITHAVTEADGKVIVILSMRADFYGHPANYPELGRLVNQNSDLVLPMNISELRNAIEKPARLSDVGLSFDSGLVAEIIFALRERDKALAGALPLLQFTLERLFEERDATQLTWETYNSLGNPQEGISGVEGAIGTHCEVVFNTLPENVKAKLGQVFLPLVNIDETTGEATRRRALQSSVIVDDETKLFVQRFIKNRLLQTGQENETVYIEITHEALFRSWERLKEWLTSAQEDLILLRQVKTATAEWHRRGKDYLRWNHERLGLVYEMIERLQPELNDTEKVFIEAEQERLQRELEDISTTHQRRYTIGERLNDIGDIREGVGVKDRLPDIAWLPITENQGLEMDFMSDEITLGEFSVPDFFMSKYLTTFGQFQTFLESDWDNLKWWYDFPPYAIQQPFREQNQQLMNYPRDNITWYQSVAFTRWMNHHMDGYEINHTNESTFIIGTNAEIRLPSVKEWIATAKTSKQVSGNTLEANIDYSTAVGMYRCEDISPSDMVGNLMEWCLNDVTIQPDNSSHGQDYRILCGSAYCYPNSLKFTTHRVSAYVGNHYRGLRLAIVQVDNQT